MDVEASQDVLIDVFERIENFFRRLEIYTDVPPTPAMTDMMVKIMVEVLDILGTTTKEMKESRAKKFLKRVAGITKLEDGLKKLDKMTNEEARMANAEVLKVAHAIDKKVQGVGVQVKVVDKKVEVVEAKVQMVIDGARQTAYNLHDEMRAKLRERLRKWQSPPDPSTSHNIACECQHEGTAEWFCQGAIFEKWRVAGPLLWIHGKPGSGKSILCSAIIQDIAMLYNAGLASMAYFYFDFRDVDKRSRHNLLSSLLVQLSARSDPFCDILSRLYKAHDNGTHQPSDSALVHCLKEMLNLPDQAPVYLILDALDECPNTSGVPSPREQVLGLVKELVGLRLPSLRVCVTSRPEVDIQDALGSLASHSVSLHDQSGQKKDIADYVRSVVNSDSVRAQRRWRDVDKDLVIKTLSERADGMFRWVFCQLETLRHCLPQNIPHILNQLPTSLDETYERVLKEIGTANRTHAFRLLQCLTVAIRPLRVEELAEILALDFDGAEEGIPKLKEDWRWKDQQEAVLSTCSSLIAIVNDGHHRVVQFSHFSVKEYLTSDRLATSNVDISHFHVPLNPAHTAIFNTCMGILLRSDNGAGNSKAKSHSPLAKYAAQHWVDHAQFALSTQLQVRMRPLFDLAMPYFETWIELFDIDQGWDGFMINEKRPHGSPLYYASLCGFCDLAGHLVAEHPQHVNATLGRCHSPLAVSLHRRHFDVAELLYQHGADVGLRCYGNRTLLHAASLEGSVDITQWLLDDARSQGDYHDAPLHLAEASGHVGHYKGVDAVDNTGRTPLHLASQCGHLEVVRLLIKHGADANTKNWSQMTPLHLASSSGIPESVQVLIELGADINARDEKHKTPLHLALSSGSPETLRVLIKHGANINTPDGSHLTPLHLVSSSGSPETLRMLIELGADINAKDGNHKTPLHLASSSESPEIAQLLIELGADANARDGNNKTPLHLASSSGRANTAQLLIKHGADIDAGDENHRTPLHLTSSAGRAKAARLLIKHGANVNVSDGSHSTPLHLASSLGSPETVRVLIKYGANVNSQDGNHKMPLHLAASSGNPETVRVLTKLGTDINARDGNKKTPLHLASSSQSPETVQLLIELGADVNAQDGNQNTPLHLASSSRHAKNARLLIKHGANVNVPDGSHSTPLHLALSFWSSEIVQALIEHGVDVNARDGSHKTPLHLASALCGPTIVRVLTKLGADVNARDGNRKTPLHLASSSQKPEIVRVLIELGADVNARDGNDETPLHLASSSWSPGTVQALIEHGADVNARNGSHNMPLHLALSSWWPETVRLLLNYGADVNAPDGSQKTPMHLASSQDEKSLMLTTIQRSKSAEKADRRADEKAVERASDEKADIVQVLIQHGADVAAQDNTGSTPLHLASSKRSGKTVELLLGHGADVNARDGKYSTPLHLAASSRSAMKGNVVPLLLSHGANVNAKDDGGQTPFQIASSSGLSEITELLSNYE
jgi:ankyrin repeat protein